MKDLLARGGKHYRAGAAIQPIELILSQRLNFAEGNIVKYVCRHRRKGGAEDIKKLIHYAEFLLDEYSKVPEGKEGQP